MGVVTIAAIDQTLVDAMMKWHLELRFLSHVAAVAKLRLRLHQQKLRIFSVVRRVAGRAGDIILGVHRI